MTADGGRRTADSATRRRGDAAITLPASPRPRAPASPTLRAGLSAAALPAFIVVLTGGWSALVMAYVGGAAAGLLAAAWATWPGRSEAARLGLRAGAAAGALLLAAQVVRDVVLAPLAAIPAPALDSTGAAGLGALLIAAAAGAAFGGVQALPGPHRTAATALLGGAFLVCYPFIDGAAGLGWLGQMIPVLIFVLLALGLNIVVGYAGLLDLGYAAFFAIGAYATGLLSSPHLGIQLDFWLVIWLAAAIAALFGVILGAPTLPLRGDYLAIVTLGFGEIVPIVIKNLTAVVVREPFTGVCLAGCERPLNLTGGVQGINPIGRPALPVLGEFRPGVYEPWYYLILGLVVFAVFFIDRLRRSRLGRAWTAIREDELAAAVMGVDLVRTKLLAFAMGATVSGFAGAFYAAYISAIFPGTFDFSVSVIVLCMVILGGMGSMTGVILGGLIIMSADRIFLPQFAALAQALLNTSVFPAIPNAAVREFLISAVDPSQLRLLLFGLTLVVMMLVRPEGLVPSARRRAELHTEEPPEAATQQPPTPAQAESPAPAIAGG